MTLDATHDTTHDTQSDTAGDSAPDALFYILSITEAADATGLSVRTIQRKLDKKPKPEWEPVRVAGKRCVKVPADALLPGVTPDATSDIVESVSFNVARDVSHDSEHDSTALARLPQDGRGAALIAAIVRETLNQAEERRAAPDASHVAAKLLLTLSECQTLTGLSRAVLREAIETKKLKAKLIGRSFRIKRPDLEAFVKAL
jgi:excisionase family DNA binding protein